MAMVVLKSSNENLSYIINKNPNSGMVVRDIRKGKAFGWYPKGDEGTYAIYFKDGDGDGSISYKKHVDDNFDYLTLSKYNSPLFVLNAVNEFFGGVLKKDRNENDVISENEFIIPFIELRRLDRMNRITRELTGVSIEYAYKGSDNYEVIFKQRGTVKDLLDNVMVWVTFVSEFSSIFLDKSQEFVDKILKSMVNIEAPYYLRHSFMVNVMVSKKMFERSKDKLEETTRYKLDLVYGGTGMQRRDFVTERLNFGRSILDIGSGEGFYSFPFAKKIKNIGRVYAVDIDEEVRDELVNKVKVRDVENLDIYGDIDEYIEENVNEEEVDVLMVEVIEHMSKEEAENLLVKVLEEVNFKKIVITTPNRDFNKYYSMDPTEMRHSDHKWEMGEEEFEDYMSDILEDYNLDYVFYHVGDLVDGISPSQSVVIKSRKEIK